MPDKITVSIFVCGAVIVIFSMIASKVHHRWAFMVVVCVVALQLFLSLIQQRHSQYREYELQKVLQETQQELLQHREMQEMSRDQLAKAIALAYAQSESLKSMQNDIRLNVHSDAASITNQQHMFDTLVHEYNRRLGIDPIVAKVVPPEHAQECAREWATLGDIPIVSFTGIPPTPIFTPQPDFPRAIQLLPGDHNYGTVAVEVTIMPSGNVCDLSIKKPLGTGFDEEALKAMSLWRFKPGQENGKPVPFKMTLEIEYHAYSSQ